MNITDKVIAHFRAEEGWKNKAYKDHLGYPTIGCGHLLEKNAASWPKYKDWVWTDEQIKTTLSADIQNAVKGARSVYGVQFDKFSANRQLAIVDNVFQMGLATYKTFVNSIKLIKDEQWNSAADNMLKSLWAKQTPNRAKRVTELLRKG